MFLRVAVLVEPGQTRQRVGAALDQAEAITTNLPSREALMEMLDHRPCDLVVIDQVLLPDTVAPFVRDLLRRERAPQLVVVGFEDDAAQRGALLAEGCLAVIPDSVDESIFGACFRTLAERRLQIAHTQLQEVPDGDFSLSDYTTASPVMRGFLKSARRAASSDSTLLIVGETGVGKGLLARAIHNESLRGGPFISISCGALTPTLVESELFGHERGAFTGANRERRGYFELAHRGTLFLDEIGELPPHLQAKLLTALEEREVQPLGSEERVKVDVRFMAATHRDLEAEVAAGRFREDLYYRLAVISLRLPPLRERVEDIPQIAQSYVDHHRISMNSDVSGIAPAATDALLRYAWPGNIRELANTMERAVILGTQSQVGLDDLPSAVRGGPPRLGLASVGGARRPWRAVRQEVLDDAERSYLDEVLRSTGGRVREAAELAGMAARSLTEKMRRHGLDKEDYRGPRRAS